MGDAYQPHVALQLGSYQGEESKPVLIISRLSPDDALRLSAALSQSAEQIRVAYDAFKAEREADGNAFA